MMFDHWTPADFVLIITSLFGGIVSVIAAWKASNASDQSKRNSDQIAETHKAVNGRMSEAIAAAKSEAFAAGHAAGFSEALPLQVTPTEPPAPA